MTITLVNVENEPGEYTGVILACGSIKKTYSHVHVHCVGIEHVN